MPAPLYLGFLWLTGRTTRFRRFYCCPCGPGQSSTVSFSPHSFSFAHQLHRHRVRLSGQERRYYSGCTLHSNTVWAVDSPSPHCFWLAVCGSAGLRRLHKQAGPRVLRSIGWWYHGSSGMAIPHCRPGRSKELQRCAFDSYFRLRKLTTSTVNFKRNGQLGWIVMSGLLVDFLLRVCSVPSSI
jgi:hypothetical protein